MCLIIKFNRINLSIPIFNISNAGLGIKKKAKWLITLSIRSLTQLILHNPGHLILHNPTQSYCKSDTVYFTLSLKLHHLYFIHALEFYILCFITVTEIRPILPSLSDTLTAVVPTFKALIVIVASETSTFTILLSSALAL